MFLTRHRSANPTLAGNLLYLVTSYHTKNHFKLQVEFLRIFWPVILGESFDRINRIDRMGEGVGE